MKNCYTYCSINICILFLSMIIVTSKGFCQTIYQEDFSSDPSFTSFAPAYAFWNTSEGYYYVNTRDNLEQKYWAHSPQFKEIDNSLETTIELDLLFENQDWGTYPGVFFYLSKPDEMNITENKPVLRIGNIYTDHHYKKIMIHDMVNPGLVTPTIQDNVWYHISLKWKNNLADINVTERDSGRSIYSISGTPFSPTNFRYLGVGYYGSPDYGKEFSPICLDNIKITNGVTQPESSKPQIYGLFIGMDYSDKDFFESYDCIYGQYCDGPNGRKWAHKYFEHFSEMSNWSVNNLNEPVLSLNPYDPDIFANKNRIEEAIIRLEDTGIKKDDIFIFYFIGHGSRSKNDAQTNNNETSLTSGDEFLILTGDGKNIDSSVLQISDDELYDYFNNDIWQDVYKIFIIGSCYSGGFWGNNSNVDEGDLGKLNRVFFYAAAEENALAYGVNGDPIYDDILLKGLKKYGHPVPGRALIPESLSALNGNQVTIYDIEGLNRSEPFSIESWKPLSSKTSDFDITIQPAIFPWDMLLPAITNNKSQIEKLPKK